MKTIDANIRAQAKKLQNLRWGPGLLRTGVVYLTLLGLLSFALALDHIVAWLLIWPLAGFVLSGFFSAMHYASHGTLYPKANWFLGQIWSLPILINFTLYRDFHRQHHRFATMAGDTEPAGEIRSVWHFLFYCLNWDFVAAFWRMGLAALWQRFPSFVIGSRAQKAVRVDTLLGLLWLGGALFLTFVNPWLMVKVYWIPLQLALAWNFLITIGEHYGCESSGNALVNTNSFHVRSRLFQYFYWNSHLHAAHHLSARVPFWQLPEFNRCLPSVKEEQRMTYPQFLLGLVRSLPLWPQPRLMQLPAGRRADFWFPLTQVR